MQFYWVGRLPLVDSLRTRLHAPAPEIVETLDRFDFSAGLEARPTKRDLTTVRYAPEGDL